MKPRPYQRDSVDAILDQFDRQGRRSTLLILPTGCGKTVVAGLLAARFKAENRRVLFLAHREELIDQAAATFEAFGLKTYVEMAERKAIERIRSEGMPDVVVGSVPTMQNSRLAKWHKTTFDLIITDEAHRAVAPSYRSIYDYFGDARHLGITATGDRTDKKNLGRVFESKAYEYRLDTAISDGWLVPIKYRKVPISIDLKGIKVVGGDYKIDELEERIVPKLEPMCRAVADMVGDEPYVVFTPDVGSAAAAATIFEQLGHPTTYVAGSGGMFGMSKEERRFKMEAFDKGEGQGLVCCQLLDEGWDSWRVRHVIIMRPTRSRKTYVQRVGRGTRPAKGLVDKYELAEERREAIANSVKPHVTVVDFDWDADDEARKPVVPITLFDDSAESNDPEVGEVAASLMAKGGGDQLDLFDVKEDAEEIVAVRRLLKIKIKGYRLNYKVIESDPFRIGVITGAGISGRPPDNKYTFPATDGQVKYLEKLGHPNPANLTKGDAGRLIDTLKRRKEADLASVAVLDKLIFLGVNPDVARSLKHTEAKERIAQLRKDPEMGDRFREYSRLANEAGRYKREQRGPAPAARPSFFDWLKQQEGK